MLLPTLTVVLAHLRDDLGLPSVLLLYLLAVIVVSAIGGLWPALGAAVAGFLLANWYFTPPLYTFTIGEGENLLALAIFLIVAATVSGFVSLAARRANEGQRARAEAETPRAARRDVDRRRASSSRSAGPSRSTASRSGTGTIATGSRDAEVGAHAERTEAALRVDGNHVLALVGPPVPDDERRLLDAFVDGARRLDPDRGARGGRLGGATTSSASTTCGSRSSRPCRTTSGRRSPVSRRP